ncbi:MAG: hypothetical protein RLZZ351_333 [Pseudomonadota bacterium]
MIRQHEKTIAWQAGAFTFLVHGILFALLLFSVHWKSVQPMNVAEVELWDTLPTTKVSVQPPPPVVEPEPVKSVEALKPETKPEPPPAPEPKADIQIKKEAVKIPPKVEKPKEPPKPEKVKEEVKPKEVPKKETKVDPDALKKLQQEMLAEDAKMDKQEPAKSAGPAPVKPAATSQVGGANQNEVSKYVGLITNKIKQHVNKQVCGSGKPELIFNISLMPTGEVIGHPKLLKTSGMMACDDAVERAILESQPLPVPSQAEVFSQFRELKLKFRPNEDG